MKFCIPIAMLVLLTAQMGCSDGNEARLPVSGTVTLDGQPLADAKVTLMPKDGRRVANALTTASGEFSSATTFSQGDGALIGDHFVAITPKDPPPMPGDEVSSPGGPGPGKAKSYVAPIPVKYGKPKESGLEVTVARGSDNSFTFDLKSK